MALVTRAGKGAPLTADDHDGNLAVLEREIERLNHEVAALTEALSLAVVNYDAKGDADAPRPAVPGTATVIWFNAPREPANMGPLDLWAQEQA